MRCNAKESKFYVFPLCELEMYAIDYKAQAESLQCESKYEEALPFMMRSMMIREESMFICLTLSELALLYLDMLKFDQVDLVCKGMLCASHRYDAERQTQIALKTLARSQQERKIGFEYGMCVQIEGLASKT